MPAPMRVSKLRTLAVLAAALAIGAPIAAQHNTAQDIDDGGRVRSEEHTSELQSQSNLVCRLLLEKKKNTALCMRPVSQRGGDVVWALCVVWSDGTLYQDRSNKELQVAALNVAPQRHECIFELGAG